MTGNELTETAAGTDETIEDEVKVVVAVVVVMKEVGVVEAMEEVGEVEAMLKFLFSRKKYLLVYIEVNFFYM